MKAGIHEGIPAAEYHADPCDAPSLSSSIAQLLISHSPLHAWTQHPKLGAAPQEESEAFDIGTAAHAWLLQGEEGFVIVDAPDWRTKAAREIRDAARAAGKVPLLAARWEDVQNMTDSTNEQLHRFKEPPRPFARGVGAPEATLIWQEDGLWLRARLDWLHRDGTMIDDYKTTSASANPERWARTMYGHGFDMQAAFYLRGLRALLPSNDPSFRFVVQETTPPYPLSVVALDPAAIDLANRKVEHAIRLWRFCLERDQWPGYPTRTCYVAPPAWEEAAQNEREWISSEQTSAAMEVYRT